MKRIIVSDKSINNKFMFGKRLGKSNSSLMSVNPCVNGRT